MRKRVLLFLGGSFLVMLAVMAVTTLLTVMRGYRDMERASVARDLQRVRASMDEELSNLTATTTDYAIWTEMYNFVRKPTAEFAQVNLSIYAVSHLHLDVIVVRNAAGRVVFKDDSGGGDGSLASELAGWLDSHPGFASLTPGSQASQGLVVLPGGILLAAAQPIRDSEESLPPDGINVMARLLDARAVSNLAARVAVTFDLVVAGRPASEAAAKHVSPGSPVFLDMSNLSTVTGWELLTDAVGEPTVLVRTETPRSIRAQGMQTVGISFLFLFLAAALFTAASLIALERMVLSRLGQLSRDVLAIGTGGSPGRRITIGGKDQIAYLGAAINGMLDALEKSTEDLRASERRTEAFLDAVPDAIFRVKRDGTITDARSPGKLPLLETANDLVGRDSEQILPLYSFLSPELFHRSIAATQTALDTGVPQVVSFHVDADSGRRWYEERFVAAGADEAIVLVREVTALKKAEEARLQEIMLKEIHHRVKNNLQVISSLLALQARAAGDSHTAALLAESRDRVRAMALLHEKLSITSDDRRSGFTSYVHDLAAHLRQSYAGNSETVDVRVEVEDVTLDLDLSVPCGLIITELLSNALKHAFPGGRRGTVTVSLHRESPSLLRLTVSDDGVGMPPGVDPRSAVTLGLRIVAMLAEQIKGSFEPGPGPGASFSVSFPA